MSLEQYRLQREQIITVMGASSEPNPDLQQIIDSLDELIALLEDTSEIPSSESSVNLIPDSAENDPTEKGPEARCSNSLFLDSDLSSAEDELHQALLHMQCRVPFQHSWGQMQYSNAMIQAVDSSPVKDDVDEVHVRVLFLQPTHRKMVPCQYYLDGKCRFEDGNCHYSHGEIYALSKLRPYEVPDYSNLVVGMACLCKGNDGIWMNGTVSEISSGSEDSNPTVSVRLQKSNSATTFEISDIIPLISEGDSDGLIPEEDDGPMEENEDNKSENDESEFTPHLAWDAAPVQQVSGEFGGWETHTRGFASKLMAKMGFIVGQGLGNRPGGRVEPITAEVLPKGRSLDFCMDLREGRITEKVGRSGMRRGGKQRRRIKSAKMTPREKTDMFSLINSQMKKVKDQRSGRLGDICIDTARATAKPNVTSTNPRQLNVEAFKLHDKVSSLERDIGKLRSSLTRNESTDKRAADVIRSKIAGKEAELSGVLRRQKAIEREQKSHKTKKALIDF